MNPRITSGGRSFKGAFQYYMHDKQVDTRERIAWTQTVNMLTSDPDKAWKVMAYTAKHQDRLKEASGIKATGRKAQRPVMAYSLSWHPEQSPEPDHMRKTALASIKLLGLEDHEAIIVAHSDTPHRHVHVIVNRVHPITGKIASDAYTQRKLSDFALEYGNTHGLTYSPQRAENKRKREEDRMTRTTESQIAEAWAVSDNGNSFVSALSERGFTLAQGNKRLVVVDQHGKIYNPVRHIDGVQTKQLRERLRGIDPASLPDAEALAQQRAAGHAAQATTPEPAPADLTAVFNAGAAAQKTEPAPQQGPEIPAPAPETEPATGEAKNDKTNAPEKPEATKPAAQANGQMPVDYVALRVVRMQERHQRERAELNEQHLRQLEREKRDMAAYYRLGELGNELKILRSKCSKKSFWRWITGANRRDRKQLAKLEMNYKDSRKRYDERIDGLEHKHTLRLEMLHAAQDRDRETILRLQTQNASDIGREATGRDAITRQRPGPDLSR